MKKYFQIFLVLAITLSVIGLARTGPAWAGMFQPAASDPVLYSPLIPANIDNAPLAAKYTITEDGLYNVGGVCLFEVDFKDPDGTKKLKIDADAEIPLEESTKVPFSGEGELFFPGCHFVHYKQDKVVNPMLTEDASTKVCFGANPDFEMRMYYYLDTPANGSPVWAEITSNLEDNGRLICSTAPYTGVYMPAGKLKPRPGSEEAGANPLFPGGVGGSVLPPPASISFSESGTYAVGGVCIIRAIYKVDGLSNDVYVAYPEEDTETVPFPGTDQGNLLYFPGCHVIHYRDADLKEQMNKVEEEGEWEICFAARPGKEMTIYYYQDDLDDVTPPWVPLNTTTADGLACAKLVDFTAIYTPAGR
ncbi:MAG: hypothetical protein CVU44_14670 [Chloroflexi bacterium HGW-Chloroflexi-6]|nr:MAG: hypothetical protein CVU44_14670 [Chloroflexi bacterium HGW-Chloroflexi-6]